MGETVVQNGSAQVARPALDRIAGGTLRDQLIGEVGRRFSQRSRDDVEEAFDEAYSRALTRCHWRRDREVYGWLRRAMINWLIDTERRERRELVADTTSGAFVELADTHDDPLRQLGRREERREVRQLHIAVLKQLNERQRRVIALHARGTARKEIARRLEASERAVKKDLTRVFRVAREQVITRSGHGCADGERLVIRYAFGLAGKGTLVEAQLHLAHCERCGRFLREIEAWREKVAVLLPPSSAAHAEPRVLERGLHKAADAVVGLKAQVGQGGANAKQHLADATVQAKQHAAAGYARAVEYAPLAGARPGAAATAIAGCLALGGGAATYCIERGVDPLGGFGRDRPADVAEATQEPLERQPPAEQPPDPPQVGVPTPESTTAEPAPPEPAPAVTPPPAPPAPQPEPTPPAVQFGEPATAAQSSPAAPAPPTPSPEPAPAPSSGGTDLYGP